MKITTKTKSEEIKKLSEVDCTNCSHCCEFGSGIILEKEIKELSTKFKLTPGQFKKKYLKEFTNFNTTHYKFKTKNEQDKPYGKCILLKDNKCSIHYHKPLHCRVGSCNEHGQHINIWFTVKHFVNEYDPESIRQWNNYIKLGNKTIPGSSPEELVPDKKRLNKMLNYEILR